MSSTNRLSAEDRLDIMDLIARYAYWLDSGDLDGYVNNFAPDGVLFEQLQGRGAIREYVAMLMRQGRAGPLANGDVAYRHFVGSPVIGGFGRGAGVQLSAGQQQLLALARALV